MVISPRLDIVDTIMMMKQDTIIVMQDTTLLNGAVGFHQTQLNTLIQVVLMD